MTQNNPYERKLPLDERYRKVAAVLLTLKSVFVFGLAIVGVVTLANTFLVDEASGTIETQPTVLATQTTVHKEPVDTTTTAQDTSTSSTSGLAIVPTTELTPPVVDTTSTSTSTTSTSSTSTTSTTLAPLKELTSVGLPPTKVVLVRVSWQAERPRPQSDGGGYDYMRGSTAEGIIIASLSAESMSVTTNQKDRRYEITVADAPTVSYALWSLSGCRTGWTGNPASEIQGECPGFHSSNPGESTPGKVREEWKNGLFYPWFSRSSCVDTADINLSTETQSAIRRRFAQVHGIDESLVRVGAVTAPDDVSLPFDIPKEIEWPAGQTVSIEGYEFEVLGGGKPCLQWPGA